SVCLPVGTVEEIDKHCRKFLWGSTNETRKIHLVNWETAWPSFQPLLPEAICMKIAAVLVPSADAGLDVMFWKHSASGQFSTSSAYSQLLPPESSNPDHGGFKCIMADTVWVLMLAVLAMAECCGV
ncbi:hypothetical protein Tsubulata_041582, partial [Turnera subulata]